MTSPIRLPPEGVVTVGIVDRSPGSRVAAFLRLPGASRRLQWLTE